MYLYYFLPFLFNYNSWKLWNLEIYWFNNIYGWSNLVEWSNFNKPLLKDLWLLKKIYLSSRTIKLISNVTLPHYKPVKIRVNLKLLETIRSIRSSYRSITFIKRVNFSQRTPRFSTRHMAKFIVFKNIMRLNNFIVSKFFFNWPISYNFLYKLLKKYSSFQEDNRLLENFSWINHDYYQYAELDYYTSSVFILKNYINFFLRGSILFIYIFWPFFNAYNWYYYY
jgi:hypothetical protein